MGVKLSENENLKKFKVLEFFMEWDLSKTASTEVIPQDADFCRIISVKISASIQVPSTREPDKNPGSHGILCNSAVISQSIKKM